MHLHDVFTLNLLVKNSCKNDFCRKNLLRKTKLPFSSVLNPDLIDFCGFVQFGVHITSQAGSSM